MTDHVKRLQKLEQHKKGRNSVTVYWTEEKGYWTETGKEGEVMPMSEEGFERLTQENDVILIKYLNGGATGQVTLYNSDLWPSILDAVSCHP